MFGRGLLALIRFVVHRLVVAVGAVGLTLVFFLVLPLMQTIGAPPEDDLILQSMDTANIPPPPPPPEDKPEEEQEEEEEPPELTEEAPLMDLEQLDLALGNDLSGDWLGGDFAQVSLKTFGSTKEDVDALFGVGDLDQEPRVIYQPGPTLTPRMRKRTPATVNIIFFVDERGRVDSPKVHSSTDPLFERAALAAIKQWKFEPGQRNGKPVRFRMRIPFTFPKGQ